MDKPGIASVTLANIYREQGHIEKAIEVIDKLIASDPHNDVYKKQRATLRKELKEKNRAFGVKKFFNKNS